MDLLYLAGVALYLLTLPFTVMWVFSKLDPPPEKWAEGGKAHQWELRMWWKIRQRMLLALFGPPMFLFLVHLVEEWLVGE